MRRYSNRYVQRGDEAPAQGGRIGRILRRLTLATLLIGLIAGAWMLYQSPLLRVERVTVVGTENLDPAMLAQMSGLKGQNVLTADTDEAEARLSQVAMIRDVSIKRQWPGEMVIRVEERHPWGYWQVGDQLYVIDDGGYVVDNGQPDEGSPTIVHIDSEHRFLPGERVDVDAVALAQQLMESAPRSLGRPVVGLEYSDRSGLTVVLEGGLRATFGDSRDLDYKVSTLYVLLERASSEGLEVHAVDLRFGDRVSFQ